MKPDRDHSIPLCLKKDLLEQQRFETKLYDNAFETNITPRRLDELQKHDGDRPHDRHDLSLIVQNKRNPTI